MVTAKKAPAKKVVAKKPVAKTVAKKAPVKKPVAKVVRKPAAPAAKTAKLTLLDAPVKVSVTYNRTTLIEHLMEQTGLEKKAVTQVLTVLMNTMQGALMPRAVGEFTLPGLFKVFLRKVPARKAGTLVRNPGTGEMMKGAAKPASVRVKMRPLSKLRQAALA